MAYWKSLELVDEIYDAALRPGGFERLGALFAKATQATNGVVVVRNGMVPIELSATTSLDAQKDYLAYYGFLDPWARAALEAPHWAITASEKHISDQELLRNEFYVDYARHLGMYHPMGATCPLDADSTITVGVNRERSAPAFASNDKRALLQLLKHLQRAMQLRARFDNVHRQANLGFAVLDTLAFGVVVADAAGRIVFANAPAEALHHAGAGLILSKGKLRAATPAEARILADLVRDAASGGAGGATRITGRNGGGALMALVGPLPSRLGEGRPGQQLALAAFRRGGDSPAFLGKVLSEMYGLSRAEAQIVSALAGGASLEAIALQRGVKPSTVKTQFEAVFRKTGAQTQRDLLRLVASLPQIL